LGYLVSFQDLNKSSSASKSPRLVAISEMLPALWEKEGNGNNEALSRN